MRRGNSKAETVTRFKDGCQVGSGGGLLIGASGLLVQVGRKSVVGSNAYGVGVSGLGQIGIRFRGLVGMEFGLGNPGGSAVNGFLFWYRLVKVDVDFGYGLQRWWPCRLKASSIVTGELPCIILRLLADAVERAVQMKTSGDGLGFVFAITPH